MSFELALIAKLIETRDMRLVRAKKVTEDFFYDPIASEMFTFVKKHFVQYGEVPTMKVVAHNFPTNAKTLKAGDDDLAVLCDKVKEKRLYNDMGELVKDVMKSAIEDPFEALTLLRSGISGMSVYNINNQDIDITKCKREGISEYNAVKNAEGILGIPYPWPTLNKISMGIHAGELIVIYARPKSGKTWILSYIALVAHMHKKRVLFLTKEMGRDQIRRRCVAIYAKVDYEAYRQGKLTNRQFLEFQENLESLEEMDVPFIVSQVESTGPDVLLDVESKIEEYDPDLVCFDGVYLCAEEWLDVAKLTRGLKAIAQKKAVPIACTTQRNRQGGNSKKGYGDLSDLAYGDSFGQDADMLLRLHRDQQQEENDELLITLPGVREAKKTSFAINFFVATNFDEKITYGEGSNLRPTGTTKAYS